MISQISSLAHRSYRTYKTYSPEARARFLNAIAAQIMALGDELLNTAHAESNLPLARLTGERGRTCGQLQMFANHILTGAHLREVHCEALPDRQPLPRSDLRLTRRPIGPVAVFGASNFPLAFSVAGGDTASALAAGCSVVAKAHPAHPKTSDLVADAIRQAMVETDMPEHVFQLVHISNPDAVALVQDSHIKGVGFTGSQNVGMLLWRAAAERKDPIPVFAEMGSINPVFVLPHALAIRAEAIAKGWAASLTLGAGQFCTNPGVLVVSDSEGLDRFRAALAEALPAAMPHPMLTEGIHASYVRGATALAEGRSALGQADAPLVVEVSVDEFLTTPQLREECFGPAGVVVMCPADRMVELAESLEGQLTATIHGDPADQCEELKEALSEIAGRLVWNGFPTGVEVCEAMQHGGPFPATTDPRFTSVGTGAIERWLRPVCYQDFPTEK